ncbi:MAG: hypothetical protein FJ083_03330 [Cyanobacteria bacterium K_Offshore_surface_m2_239]|nr:hypothetical protein [Cyanobacteria bacterium K_Offshore_surface_m2_239]
MSGTERLRPPWKPVPGSPSLEASPLEAALKDGVAAVVRHPAQRTGRAGGGDAFQQVILREQNRYNM